MQLIAVWQELRPLQWVKNGFVLLPLFFSGKATETDAVVQAVIAALLFSAIASGLYIWNDLFDREEDRRHPVKRLRPIASGRLPVAIANVAALLLIAGSLSAGFVLNPSFGWILTVYATMTVLYSLKLKQIILFDTLIIALGFLLRVLAGGIMINVAISEWLFITVAFLALFLAVLKRHAEFTYQAQPDQRRVLGAYTKDILHQMIGVGLTGTIVSYSLYTFSRPSHELTRWSILIAMYAMFRYLFVAFRSGKASEPERFVVTDKPLMLSLAILALFLGLVLYGWS